jgi:hypothetical protein
VPPPAAGLPPQSFGPYRGGWKARAALFALFVVVQAPAVLISGLAGFSPGSWLVFAGSGMLFLALLQTRNPRVAGGDGWLMLLGGRGSEAWVRTDRLVHVSIEPRYAGDGDWEQSLRLRDDEGRELQVWLSKLPAGAAASLLAGIERSAEAAGADVGSTTARAAVEALYELAGATTPAPSPQPLDDRDPGERPDPPSNARPA